MDEDASASRALQGVLRLPEDQVPRALTEALSFSIQEEQLLHQRLRLFRAPRKE